MDQNFIKSLGLDVEQIEKIEVGFSHDIYFLDDQYVLKICRTVDDNWSLSQDIFYCNLFKEKLPVAQIVKQGKTDDGRRYFVYRKIIGDNLYNVWHDLSVVERRMMIKQICDLLRVINSESYQNFKPAAEDPIEDKLNLLRKRGDLPEKVCADVEALIARCPVKDSDFALINWDLHFDNFLVADGEIVGFLDLERCVVAPLDYQIALVKRMVRNPKKYASEHAEQFIDPDDYKDLLNWYREFYPEMFVFDNIEARLNLWAIDQCLGDMVYFADSAELLAEVEEWLQSP